MSNYNKRQKGYLVKLDERLPRTKYCTDFLREEYETAHPRARFPPNQIEYSNQYRVYE